MRKTSHGCIDMTGRTVGRLTVMGRAPHQMRFGKLAWWECRCTCGRRVLINGHHLRTGNTRSCGCLKNDIHRARLRKHGRCNTREYTSWSAAKTRCYNRKQPSYAHYGGRGITMCRRWRLSFVLFLRDMGPCPPGYSLDRIDVHGGYTPRNCRWASLIEQQNNTTANRLVEHRGETYSVSEWERRLGFTTGTLKRRLLIGWPVERAFTESLRPVHWVTFRGERKPLTAWARQFTISPQTVTARLQRGWSSELALTTPALDHATNRRNRLLTFNGVTKRMKEWARSIGLGASTLQARLNRYGWSVERALSTPVRRH